MEIYVPSVFKFALYYFLRSPRCANLSVVRIIVCAKRSKKYYKQVPNNMINHLRKFNLRVNQSSKVHLRKSTQSRVYKLKQKLARECQDRYKIEL